MMLMMPAAGAGGGGHAPYCCSEVAPQESNETPQAGRSRDPDDAYDAWCRGGGGGVGRAAASETEVSPISVLCRPVQLAPGL